MTDNVTPVAVPPSQAASFDLAAEDISGGATRPVLLTQVKLMHGAHGTAMPASAASPVPVSDTALAAALTTLLGQTDGVEAALAAIVAKLSADPATQTTLASVLTAVQALATAQPLPAGAATSAAQTTGNTSLAAIVTALAAVLTVAPKQGTHTDRSSSITAGGTAQTLMAANAARLGYSVQNTSAADLWISGIGTAASASPSLKLSPGAYFETPPGYGSLGAISIFGATTAQTFSAREW